MFTGIVEQLAPVVLLRRGTRAAKLAIDLTGLAQGVAAGDSIAISGACLTVASISGTVVTFDVVEETLRRTTLGDLLPGDRVNVERAIQVGGRLAGHFVQGHVDAVGTIKARQVGSEGGTVAIAAGPQVMRFAVEKGSIAVDGISLTIASLSDTDFTVAVIPTTLQRTTLGTKDAGSRVNLETDVLAKLVAKLLLGRGEQPGGVTEDSLREQGFA